MLLHTEADADVTCLHRPIHPVDDATIVVRVLGEVEAVGPCGTFAARGARPGALLALLAIAGGAYVAVDRIIDELWATEPAARDVKRVQVNVLRLRRALARAAPALAAQQLVQTRVSGYSLEIEPDDIDAERFARLVARGRRELTGGDARRAATTLSEALWLWRGEPYADYAYEPFAAAEIRRLEDLRQCAHESWVEAQLALGAHALMAAELGRMLAREPLRERLYALLMVALYRSGRQGDALRTYHRAHTTLVDALGVRPGPELRRLQRAILDQSPSLDLDGHAVRSLPVLVGQAA
jgi:DNA-binding SARP family transcriptional activator